MYCTILNGMTPSDAPTAPSFRKMAKEHALAAHQALLDAPTRPNQADRLLELAEVHALVSLACSEVAPPERRPCTSRTVDLFTDLAVTIDEAR